MTSRKYLETNLLYICVTMLQPLPCWKAENMVSLCCFQKWENSWPDYTITVIMDFWCVQEMIPFGTSLWALFHTGCEILDAWTMLAILHGNSVEKAFIRFMVTVENLKHGSSCPSRDIKQSGVASKVRSSTPKAHQHPKTKDRFRTKVASGRHLRPLLSSPCLMQLNQSSWSLVPMLWASALLMFTEYFRLSLA